MSKIELLLLIVFLLLLILLFKYLQTKRQIRNLSKQIAELVNGKSEKMLDISLIDKDLEQLAGILNQYNDNQRQLIASTLRHENYLKESIANISHDLNGGTTSWTLMRFYPLYQSITDAQSWEDLSVYTWEDASEYTWEDIMN